jgi:uncharacterized protein (DUF1800 family)
VDHASAEPGFLFRRDTHQPGDKTLLGHRFPEGEAGGMVALDMLANHPATFRHLATQLVAHFVSDDPPENDVAQIMSVLHESQGDLGAASLALVRLRHAWIPLKKFRPPLDHAVALIRALDLPPDVLSAHPGQLHALGRPLWAAVAAERLVRPRK